MAATRAAAQGKLDRVEWSVATGESFLTLGRQSGVYQVAGLGPSAGEPAPYQATIIFPGRFSSASHVPPLFVGLAYRVSPSSRIQLDYSLTVNTFGLQPVSGSARSSSTFERVPAVTLNYARYLGSISGWKGFAVGGAGVVWQSSLVTGLDEPDPSFDFGAGMDHRINDRIAFRVEARDYVERLPSPLHGYGQDIAPSAGIVISSRPPGTGSGGPSPIEFYLEGGGSFFTRGSVSGGACTPGQGCGNVNTIVQNDYSGAGRYAGGFRIYLSRKNALQGEYSVAPNHFRRQLSSTGSPTRLFPSFQSTESVYYLTVDYVRYLPGPGAVQPFVGAGGGWAHFAGLYAGDVGEYCWDARAGVDFPLNRQLALRLEMNDFLLHQPSPPPYPAIHSWTNNLTPMVGLALRFR